MMRYDDAPEAFYAVIPISIRREAWRNARQWRAYEAALSKWQRLPRKERRRVAMPCPPDGLRGGGPVPE